MANEDAHKRGKICGTTFQHSCGYLTCTTYGSPEGMAPASGRPARDFAQIRKSVAIPFVRPSYEEGARIRLMAN